MVGHEKQEPMPKPIGIGRGMNEMFKSMIGELEETLESKLGEMKGSMEEQLNVNNKVMENRMAVIEEGVKEMKDLLVVLVGKSNGKIKAGE